MTGLTSSIMSMFSDRHTMPLTRDELANELAYAFGADHVSECLAACDDVISHGGVIYVFGTAHGQTHVGQNAPSSDWHIVAFYVGE